MRGADRLQRPGRGLAVLGAPLVGTALIAFAARSAGCDSSALQADDVAAEDPRVTASDGGTDRATAPDVEEPDPPPPPGLPKGWVRFDGYTKACGLFIPESDATVPPPLIFKTCPAGLNPATLDCMYIEPTWTSTLAYELFSPWMEATRGPDGVVHLQVSQFVGDWAYRLVIDGSGKVEHAILETRPNDCTLGGSYIRDGRYAYHLAAYGGSQRAAVIGKWSERMPSLVVKFAGSDPHVLRPTPFGLFDGYGLGHQMAFISWETGVRAPDFWSDALDDGLQQVSVVVADDALFWRASTSDVAKLRVYTPAGGVKELHGYGSDTTQGDFAVGTDGTDLVWQHGYGRASVTSPYPSSSLMKAPYTTNPATLAPARVRSDGFSPAVTPMIVGCGYAARSDASFARITRLSDGTTWTFPWGDPASSIQWTRPLAISCDELFIAGQLKGTKKLTIAKLRLDSLGPGSPAD